LYCLRRRTQVTKTEHWSIHTDIKVVNLAVAALAYTALHFSFEVEVNVFRFYLGFFECHKHKLIHNRRAAHKNL
ncbi:MAG: hypothetical protein NTW55_06720, partial [Planctomycetota bacterium]|nr:hypothetical protein [Planctomycetota bacterium]